MKHILNSELKSIEKLVIQGEYKQAHELIDQYLDNVGLSIEDHINCKILKTRIYYLTQPYSLSLEFGEDALEKSKEISNNYLIFDSAIRICNILMITGRIDEMRKKLEIVEQALNSIENKDDIEYLRRKSLFLRSRHGYSSGFDVIFESLSQSMKIAEQINDDYEKARVLFDLGNLHSFFDKKSEALTFYEQCLTVAEKTGDIELMMGSQTNTADIYMLKGELEEAFKLHKNALVLAKKMNSPFIVAILLGDIGFHYWHKGDIISMYSYYEQSIASFEQAKNTTHWHYPTSIFNLALISLELEDVKRAVEIQDKIESIKNQHEDTHLSHRLFTLLKVIILKHQLFQGKETDTKTRLQIERILEDVSFAKFVYADLNKIALFHLCDFYVNEYHSSKDDSIYEKLKTTISRFTQRADKQKSYVLLAEAYLFESQMKLIDFNTNEAKNLLNKAQKIADEKGIYKLGTLISNTHDKLIEQHDLWENATHQLPDIIERMGCLI